jgi:glycosyltransferase involved in cell wall biosynthesis
MRLYTLKTHEGGKEGPVPNGQKDQVASPGSLEGRTTRKKVIILFPDEWLSHSPTVLNIAHNLSDRFDITIFAVDDGIFHNDALVGDLYRFVRIPRGLSKFFLRKARTVYDIVKACLLYRALTAEGFTHPPDEVIAVDALGLWVALRLFDRCHFLSLEVKKDWFFRHTDLDRVDSIIIQTEARYRFLFEEPRGTVFYVQNAPALTSVPVAERKTFRRRLIFFGNVMPSHGLFDCLETIDSLCQSDGGYTLTIKGVIPKAWVRAMITIRYRRLFQRSCVTLDEQYTPQAEIIDYLSAFDIGFCLYDFRLIAKNDFNYLSVPSGKLFNFYAAGVPVIGVDIPGLHSVREFKTGVLVDRLSAGTLRQAVAEITRDYDQYRRNCRIAAEHFDFQKAVGPFREFLTNR